jgi:hypothetical protein
MDALALVSNCQEAQKVEVKVADLSQSGMRLYVSSRITRGTSVHVEYENLVAKGVVWHSRRFKDGYSIGIEFQRIDSHGSPTHVFGKDCL